MIRSIACVFFALGLGAVQAEVVVIGHPSATALNKAQLQDVFLGKNLGYSLFDHPEGSAIREEFYNKVTGRDAAQMKATWSRIAFSGKGQPPKVVPDASAVKKAVAADPKAIGYIASDAVDGSVKVLLKVD